MKKYFFLAVIAILIGALAQSCCPNACDAQPVDDLTITVADLPTTFDEIAVANTAAELPPAKYGTLTLLAQDGYLRIYHFQYEDKEFILSSYFSGSAGGIVQIESGTP